MISTTMDNCEAKHQEAHLQELKDRLPGSRNRDQQGGVVLNPLIPDYVEGRDLPVLSRKNRAAVLICIFEGQDGELRVILTRRSMKLSSHPGDVALPGGKTDEGDVDDSATALREAMEEIGLNPCLVRVMANLEPFISSNLLTVVPVIGLLSRVEDFKPVLNEDEVDAIFDVPLGMFLEDDGRHRCIEKEWGRRKYACHVFDVESERGSFIIGGLTASILIRAASYIYKRSPSFNQSLQDFSQLQWALSSAK